MLNTQFSPWPAYSQEEAEAVKNILLSNKVNYWTGNEGKAFEKEFAAWVGSEYAIAVSNGTVALELSLAALAIVPGDEVIVTPRTFFATVSSIVNIGARPVFADVDINSQNITVDSIKQVLSSKTKAIICVHLAGWPCDMDPIMELAEQHHLYVIEDCAQAHGAKYKGRSVGSIGHIGAWSFCQDKIITTGGEGGMVTTSDQALWLKMWSLKDHGKSWKAVYEQQHPPGFRWLHEGFGTNWRMTEMQAAVGRIQLKQMSEWVKKRQLFAERINNACEKYDCIRVTRPPSSIQHVYYKCYVFVKPEKLPNNWSRNRIIEEITKRGVPCYQGTCSEVYLEKAFDKTQFRPTKRLPIAKQLGETSLMFLVHPSLTEGELEKMCFTINEVLSLVES
ncbi:DegT/DnrJ/EryC1/StrS family aminotransferase [Spartinivicinus poritis]|uniref:DegT/DnrJ/EryC1/StrS aminotransferase family protein n=1 Tax=Spartinivicinus poritis TaxID=2994640 RepID=A0ABT5U7B3_9GAMM|nr:DegT/DnrJ/EryC1/StrS aminotransferase family protein [Spartinivicinus sp. A2-2]MDE1462261.1 DegT/DnrJ/EryC1/StrS aminotransferase family protein [Spartinivicinus sp. A2-2]